jgi:hypothetical protein
MLEAMGMGKLKNVVDVTQPTTTTRPGRRQQGPPQ